MPTTRKTRTSTRKPGIMSRLRGRKAHATTTTTTTTTRTTKTTAGHRAGATTHHHKRKPSLKDKVSGAMLKLKGTMTRRPGEKAAGTRRMRGTDGRGSHRRY
ncbi:uncharacterized protein LTHEOB_5675 [Neofusicoccum parvum]|uniref:Uncharacterized protein LTHEOB_5675 n=1 Tax=Neofusicoccum parvum TaxID=310453 RepID=A0ACB5SQJ3_9PEZI|nr:uncharacterized protein LTHEOB_5675 [Neofusicoccum parvum]GME53450.1 uncharacterized protein LTHEOB_5675 [Neofusicoccum parvum]